MSKGAVSALLSFGHPERIWSNFVEVLAEVAWTEIHLGESWGDYRCGVKFIDISPEDMTKFKRFLSSLSG
jgi:hypothetical protein